MAFSGSLKVAVNAVLTNPLDLVNAEVPHVWNFDASMQDGTGSLQAQNVFTDRRTLAASASETLDLNGTLVNVYGANVTLTKVRALIIKAASTNVNDVVFGPNSTNGFVSPFNAAADRIKVKPGGVAVLLAPEGTAGYAVTAGTGDLLFVQNSGAGSSVDYDVIVIGS